MKGKYLKFAEDFSKACEEFIGPREGYTEEELKTKVVAFGVVAGLENKKEVFAASCMEGTSPSKIAKMLIMLAGGSADFNEALNMIVRARYTEYCNDKLKNPDLFTSKN